MVRKNMKKILAVVCMGVMAVSACACGDTAESVTSIDDTSSGQQVANPWSDDSSLAEAETNAGFKVNLPEGVDGYTDIAYSSVSNELIQADYENGDKYVCFRKGMRQGKAEDISGDFNEYAVTENKDVSMEGDVGSATVTMKGDGSKVYLATWSADNYNYSISSSEGIDFDYMSELIRKFS